MAAVCGGNGHALRTAALWRYGFHHQYDASWFNWCRSNQTRLFMNTSVGSTRRKAYNPFSATGMNLRDIPMLILPRRRADQQIRRKLCLQELANLDLEKSIRS